MRSDKHNKRDGKTGSAVTVLRGGRANLACFTQEPLEEEPKVSRDFDAVDDRLVSER